MKKMILFFIVLVLAIWLGLHIAADPGYAMFSYRNWSAEMPLWFAGLSLLILFGVLYFVLRLLSNAGAIAGRLSNWSGRRQMRLAHSRTTRGLIELTEGNWQTAEKLLVKAVPSSDSPLINYLAAARAAQAQGDHDRRDKYLRKAQKSTPHARTAIELTQAQLQISHGQLEQALATLRHLQSLSPHHPYVLKLLHRLYIQLGDWESLRNMLPDLMRKKVLKAPELNNLEIQVYKGVLQGAAKVEGSEHLQSVWRGFPKSIHKNVDLVAQYVEYLIQRSASDKAEVVVRDIIKKQWDDKLVRLYGLTHSADANKQLTLAESWLRSRPNNASLLLTLGRLCINNQLWGKARTYLENSIELEPRTETYAELAKLLERIGETELAANYYRLGLINSIEHKPDMLVLGHDTE